MMNIITWNVRGINGRSKQRILCNSIMTKYLDNLFLQETKCAGEGEKYVLRRCWRHCKFIYNDSKGAAGGLKILWNPPMVIFCQPFFTSSMMSGHYHALGSNMEGVSINYYRPQNNQ
jgi:exonuclease III